MWSAARNRPAVRAVAALSATIVLALAVWAGPVRADSSDTKKSLNAAKKDLDALVAKIAGENKTLAQLQSQLDATAKKIDDVTGQIEKTQFEIIQVQQDVDIASQALNQAQAQLDQRAWVAYESGPGSNLEFLLGATSLSDLSDRLEIVNAAAQSDADLINTIAQKRSVLEGQQVKLDRLNRQLQKTRTTYLSAQKDLESQQAAAQKVLDQLDKDRASADSLVRSLTKKYNAQLSAERAALQQQGSHGGTSISGVLKYCPVKKPVAYSDSFGAPRYSGGYHPHAGNDIMAPLGTPIYAPFDGAAEDGSNGLGGLTVTVTGSFGYVYNAHLSAYGKTGSVQTGDVIGYVGNTGDASGGAYHDHFEWHPNVIPDHPYKSVYGYTVINGAIDPYPYLNSVC